MYVTFDERKKGCEYLSFFFVSANINSDIRYSEMNQWHTYSFWQYIATFFKFLVRGWTYQEQQFRTQTHHNQNNCSLQKYAILKGMMLPFVSTAKSHDNSWYCPGRTKKMALVVQELNLSPTSLSAEEDIGWKRMYVSCWKWGWILFSIFQRSYLDVWKRKR